MKKIAKLPLAKPHIVHFLGPCVSFLCLIHCFGFALMSALAPGVLKLLPHSEWIEILVVFVSTIFGYLSFERLKPSLLVERTFYALSLMGGMSLYFHYHPTFHVAVLGMALIQLSLTVYRHFIQPKSAKICCENEHGS